MLVLADQNPIFPNTSPPDTRCQGNPTVYSLGKSQEMVKGSRCCIQFDRLEDGPVQVRLGRRSKRHYFSNVDVSHDDFELQNESPESNSSGEGAIRRGGDPKKEEDDQRLPLITTHSLEGIQRQPLFGEGLPSGYRFHLSDDTDHNAENLDIFGVNRRHRLIPRFETVFGSVTVESLERGVRTLDKCNDRLPVGRGLLTSDDHEIAVVDVVFDHGLASHLESKVPFACEHVPKSMPRFVRRFR